MTDYQYHTTPDEGQRQLFELSRDEVNFAFFMDAGVGKSKPAIDTAAYLYEHDKIDALLVVADNGVHQNWSTTEVLKHMPPRVNAKPVAYVNGRSLNKFYSDLSDACRDFPVVCVSHDTITTETGQRFLMALMKQRRCMLVVDESQKYKTPSAKRTRAIWKLAALAPYRRILTGTSVTEGYADLYSQFRILDWNIIGCHTFAEFKAEYCIIKQWDGFATIEGYRNVPQLLAKIRPYMWVERLVLDAPTPKWSECLVPLTPEQKRTYDELASVFLTEIQTGQVVSADLTITRTLRLSQITSGHVKLDDGEFVRLPTNRPEAVRRLLQRHPGEKVLVWCAYQDDVTLLMDELADLNPARFDGGIPHAEAMAEKTRFQTDPTCRALVLTMSKGARGYTLVEATVSIYYSYNESYEMWTQSRARNYRRGQDKQVNYYVLVAPGTQDRKMIRTVNRKNGMAQTCKDLKVFQGWLTNPDVLDIPTGIEFSQKLRLDLSLNK